MRVQKVHREKVLKMDGPSAQGFLSLTALRAEGCGGGFAAELKKGDAADAAGCVEGLCSLRSRGDSACGAEGGGGGFAAIFKVSVTGLPSRPHRHSEP